MSRTTFDLEELRRRAAQRKGGDKLTVTVDGKPYSIPAPGFWPDELKEAAKNSRHTGDIPFVRKLMGTKQYEAFTAAGGRADDLLLLIEEYKQAQGVDDLGESSPSPTS
ncbi:hypothetical protein [Streptomyces sp. MP131-18]|uniref:hypothetical protein n=1 Tax=Streptomyces sp. MP131-18 TaxID=1857892 RepID=UPI00097C613F|nr:hypothetical protein [Streptomyces sp. MP131-18]ONK09434.1 hypothetical protein STBA_01340 [Streptomyces sp. MP131-18]